MIRKNISADIPGNTSKEVFEDIVSADGVRIERIISNGHSSPDSGWYDQDENEWVMVIKGSARLVFEGDQEVLLCEGDYLNIPRHTKHKVAWTDPDNITVWLAVFYR